MEQLMFVIYLLLRANKDCTIHYTVYLVRFTFFTLTQYRFTTLVYYYLYVSLLNICSF